MPNDRLEKVRNVFAFCCFTGLAFTDADHLRPEHISTDENGVTWIHKHREKTAVMSRIPLLPHPIKLLEKYKAIGLEGKLLPVPSNQRMNSYLKEISAICNIDKTLTTHCARHTFACLAVEYGMPIDVLAKILGHTNTNMTRHYAKADRKGDDEDRAGIRHSELMIPHQRLQSAGAGERYAEDLPCHCSHRRGNQNPGRRGPFINRQVIDYMIIINNIAYRWSMITLASTALGINESSTVLEGVSGIKWNKKRKIESNYGMGGKPISRGFGNITYTTLTTMNYATQQTLRSPYGSLMDIGDFDLIFSFSILMTSDDWTTTPLKSCIFDEDCLESQQDDVNITHEFSLNPFDVKIGEAMSI